jgi:hypothetical protein
VVLLRRGRDAEEEREEEREGEEASAHRILASGVCSRVSTNKPRR